MAGLTCALRASELGMRVALLEATSCGGGATGRSSGFITPASELELDDLVSSYGDDGARELWAFAQGGCDAIQDLARSFGTEVLTEAVREAPASPGTAGPPRAGRGRARCAGGAFPRAVAS